MVLKQSVAILFVTLLILYGAACLGLYLQQTRMMFFPSSVIETTPGDLGLVYEEVWVPVVPQTAATTRPIERLHGWWIPAEGRERGVLLYLHGNGSNVGGNVAHASRFQQMGLSVLLIDYRGYGKSEGAFPSEAAVYEDAAAAWQYLTETRQIMPGQIVIYGHSLGGAIALNLASQLPTAAGIIVQSSFTSMFDMVHRSTVFGFLPIQQLLTQRFDSIRKVSQLQMPSLFIHGIDDVQVPADMSEALYAAAPQPKRLWLVPNAGHNNVADIAGAEYFKVVEHFLEKCLSR